MRVLLILIVFILPATTSWSNSAPIPMSPELEAFLVRDDQQKQVMGLMRTQWTLSVKGCNTPELANTNVLVEVPPVFKGGDPVSGQWRVIGKVIGCGQERIFNVQYWFPGGKIKRTALLPGTTVADIRLQRDALMYAVLGMEGIMPENCKDIQFSDTQFAGFDGEPGHSSWLEKWTVHACGTKGVVKMHFIPDATGTTITSKASETERL